MKSYHTGREYRYVHATHSVTKIEKVKSQQPRESKISLYKRIKKGTEFNKGKGKFLF